MMIGWQSRFLRFAPPVLGLAVCCAAGAQARTEVPAVPRASVGPRTATANSIDPVEAGLQFDKLVARFRNSSSLLRVQTLEAIGDSAEINGERADGILQDALKDPDPLVGETALRVLLHRGDRSPWLLQESALTQYPGETADLAHVYLASLDQDTSALRELMLNGNAPVQESAFEELAANDTAAAVEMLKTEFLNVSSLHRLQTLELFVRSPYTNSSATLMPILDLASKDEDPLVRDYAKQMLTNQRAEAGQEQETQGLSAQ